MAGRALESIGGFATNPSSTFTTVTMATGDSNTLRSAPPPSQISIVRVVRGGATAGAIQVTSPQLHDSTRGIRVPVTQTVTPFTFPRGFRQPAVSSDALTIQVTGGAAETDVAALMVLYENASWGGQRLAMPGDILGLVRNIKIMEVDLTTTATGSAWKDSAFNTTEDLLHSGHDYAVLGVISDTQVTQLGLKGPDTLNMRIALPCVTSTEDTADGFVRLSEQLGAPAIPIINADNRYQSYVCAFDYAGATAIKASLVLAELTQRLNV